MVNHANVETLNIVSAFSSTLKCAVLSTAIILRHTISKDLATWSRRCCSKFSKSPSSPSIALKRACRVWLNVFGAQEHRMERHNKSQHGHKYDHSDLGISSTAWIHAHSGWQCKTTHYWMCRRGVWYVYAIFTHAQAVFWSHWTHVKRRAGLR